MEGFGRAARAGGGIRLRAPDTRGERATKAVLAALAEGRMTNGHTGGLTVERVIDGIGKAMLAGVVVLAVFAVGQKAVLATLTLGLFAALASAAAGAALGFLFALPSSAARVVVAPPPAPAPPDDGAIESAGAAAQQAAAREVEDWFRDNTALERLSDWLVGAIIALSLANFEAWRLRLQELAVEVTRAMGIGGGEWGAPAGVIMAAYAILGFLGGYLWTRRYMAAELSRARADARAIQVGAMFPASEAAAIRARGDVGQAVSGVNVAPQAEEVRHAVEHAHLQAQQEGQESAPAAGGWAELVEPGNRPDDPWYGQFGPAMADGLGLSARVLPVEGDPDFFGIDLSVHGRPGQRVRLYLHPTFPDAIRELVLDASGRAQQRLLAWGAFTVGAQFDTGELRELNLAALPDAPARFRAR